MNQAKEMLANVWTAALSKSGNEAVVGGWAAAVGVFISAALGGWDKALQVLLTLMVVDYLTGVAGAFRNKTVNSDTMFWGGIRKITVLVVVMLAAMADSWVQPDAPIFRTAAIYFYVGREGLSVVENLGTLGVPLPGKLRDWLEQLNKQEEKTNASGK
ncbi:phage holin family protein [Cohnella lubricantis]|uniref:phage holin family protein n=1 Tax=Cohnella lubricantis TaxID=2163172 RepID=UPI0028933A3B|nr:phage holin family protein [Cohnella lubricantis]MBP2116581.1 toxin secretion/phage lysis holin [Cohnella lubricantis]